MESINYDKYKQHINIFLMALMLLNIECWGSNKELIAPNGETVSYSNKMVSSQDTSLLHNPEDSSSFGLNSKRQYNEDSKEDSCTHTDKFRKTTANSKIDGRREQSKNRTQQTLPNSQKSPSETLPQTQRTPNSQRSPSGTIPQSQQPHHQTSTQSNQTFQSTTVQNILDVDVVEGVLLIGHFKLHNIATTINKL